MSDVPTPASPSEPQFTMEPGWSPLLGILPASTGARFVSKDDSGQRLRVRYYRRDADGALMGKVWFGPGTEGPPGHAHGGAMAAVLDEAMGYGAWISGHAVVAARIPVEFKTLLPLGAEVLLEAWVERSEGRKVHMRAHLLGPDGKPYSRSEGLFVVLGAQRFGELRDKAAAAGASEDTEMLAKLVQKAPGDDAPGE